eukprot:1014662-Pleurochrysis_carterae.AAC.3
MKQQQATASISNRGSMRQAIPVAKKQQHTKQGYGLGTDRDMELTKRGGPRGAVQKRCTRLDLAIGVAPRSLVRARSLQPDEKQNTARPHVQHECVASPDLLLPDHRDGM